MRKATRGFYEHFEELDIFISVRQRLNSLRFRFPWVFLPVHPPVQEIGRSEGCRLLEEPSKFGVFALVAFAL